MIDIGVGLGGASQAMKERGWNVITVDINPDFKPSVVADVRNWKYSGENPDLIWCSPPCDEFAREFMPWCKTGRLPDMTILEGCIKLIQDSRPRYWVIENVKGAQKWFYPYIGKPSYVCNPYYLWGFFPNISHVKVSGGKEKLSSTQAAKRAAIPRKLSVALATAIEQSIELPIYEEERREFDVRARR